MNRLIIGLVAMMLTGACALPPGERGARGGLDGGAGATGRVAQLVLSTTSASTASAQPNSDTSRDLTVTIPFGPVGSGGGTGTLPDGGPIATAICGIRRISGYFDPTAVAKLEVNIYGGYQIRLHRGTTASRPSGAGEIAVDVTCEDAFVGGTSWTTTYNQNIGSSSSATVSFSTSPSNVCTWWGMAGPYSLAAGGLPDGGAPAERAPLSTMPHDLIGGGTQLIAAGIDGQSDKIYSYGGCQDEVPARTWNYTGQQDFSGALAYTSVVTNDAVCYLAGVFVDVTAQETPGDIYAEVWHQNNPGTGKDTWYHSSTNTHASMICIMY